jgi:hypothetical protein
MFDAQFSEAFSELNYANDLYGKKTEVESPKTLLKHLEDFRTDIAFSFANFYK